MIFTKISKIKSEKSSDDESVVFLCNSVFLAPFQVIELSLFFFRFSRFMPKILFVHLYRTKKESAADEAQKSWKIFSALSKNVIYSNHAVQSEEKRNEKNYLHNTIKMCIKLRMRTDRIEAFYRHWSAIFVFLLLLLTYTPTHVLLQPEGFQFSPKYISVGEENFPFSQRLNEKM